MRERTVIIRLLKEEEEDADAPLTIDLVTIATGLMPRGSLAAYARTTGTVEPPRGPLVPPERNWNPIKDL